MWTGVLPRKLNVFYFQLKATRENTTHRKAWWHQSVKFAGERLTAWLLRLDNVTFYVGVVCSLHSFWNFLFLGVHKQIPSKPEQGVICSCVAKFSELLGKEYLLSGRLNYSENKCASLVHFMGLKWSTRAAFEKKSQISQKEIKPINYEVLLARL